MLPEIEIYDTTLRDGSQGEGINFSVEDKLLITEKLDAFGAHFIEGGWPGSNPKEMEFFARAKMKKFKNAKLAAFGSTRKAGLAVGEDDQIRLLLGAETPVVTIFGKASILHVKEILQCSEVENLAMIGDTVAFLKDHGKFVVFDAEHFFDGYKLDPEYAIATLLAAEKAGADVVVLCDTNGGSLPNEIGAATRAAVGTLKCKVGIHTHNDIELAVANTLAAIEAGAVQVQGTINGYGERIGNCNLTSLIPCLAFKLGKVSVPAKSLRKLKELSLFVDGIANLSHNPRQPWVGSSAFAHKGGAHVNAVQKLDRSYEHVNPAVVGNERVILVSEQSGRSNIMMKARELGFDITPQMPALGLVVKQVKKLEHEGYEFEAADGSLALLIRKLLHLGNPPFEVKSYTTTEHRNGLVSSCHAKVQVIVKGGVAEEEADGTGPVNALDLALRAALSRFYPQVAGMKLIDYKVRSLDSRSGTQSKTRVLIESTNGREQWGTVGVHDNIVEASLCALAESMEYGLFRDLGNNRGGGD